jgi:hypothetical protein
LFVYISIKDMFGTTSFHKIQLNFKNDVSNTPNFSAPALRKKNEVDPNFMILMKQQNRCFTNRHF